MVKNVVVIGLGQGGTSAARELASKLPETHRVVAITTTEAGFYPIAALRAAVVPVSVQFERISKEPVNSGSRTVWIISMSSLFMSTHSSA